MPTSEEPISCTLNAQDAEAQSLEWVGLRELATNVVPIPSGARMRFPAAHSARIADLAEREAACCAFLDVNTLVEADEFVVEITADNPDAIGFIELLAGLAAS